MSFSFLPSSFAMSAKLAPLAIRSAAALAAPGRAGDSFGAGAGDGRDDGHRIFVDPWADHDEPWHDTRRRSRPGPSELP